MEVSLQSEQNGGISITRTQNHTLLLISRLLVIKNRIVLFFLFVIGVVISSYSLYQTSYAPGWDSYFYIDQVKSWFELGHLHSSRLNIIYPLLIGIQYLTGDYVLSYKILTILSYSFCAPLFFIIGKNLKLSFWHCVLLGILFLSNPASIYFASQFTKNLISIVLLLILLSQLIKRNHLLVVSLIILLGFSHKLTFALAVLIYTLHETFFFLKQKKLNYLAPFCLFPFALLGFYVIAPHNLDFPKFHLWSLYTTHNQSLSLATFIGAVVLFSLLVLAYYKSIKNTELNPLQFSLIATCSLLLFPFLKWDLTGYSFRFLMVFLVLSPLLVSGIKIKNNKLIPLSILTLVLCYFSFTTYNPKTQDPHYVQYHYISNRLENKVISDKTGLIICHKALAEFLSFQLNRDVLPWGIPTEEVNPSTFRLVYIPSYLTRELTADLQNNLIEKITSNYYYMSEETWTAFISHRSTSDKLALLTWRNPTNIRSSALVK